MIISCRSLVLAVSLLLPSGRVEARSEGAGMAPSPSTSSSTSSTNFASTQASVLALEQSKTSSPVAPGLNSGSALERIGPNPNDPFGVHWHVSSKATFTQKASFEFILYRTEAFNALNATIIASKADDTFALVLAQTSAKGGDVVAAENTHWIAQLFFCQGDICPPDPRGFVAEVWEEGRIDQGVSWTKVDWTFEHNSGASIDRNNFFLCFGVRNGNGFACQSWSDFFTIDEPGSEPPDQKFTGLPAMPTGQIISLDVEPSISYKGMPKGALPTSTATSPISTGITITSFVSATAPTAGVVGSNPVSGSRGNKLSIGATVGIALGSLVVVSLLALLALFFCIRRRRRAHSAGTTHEQAMLTRSHPDSTSQDRLAEKDNAVQTLIHPNSNDSSFQFSDQNDTTFRQTLILVSSTAYGSSGENNNSSFRDTESREIHSSPYDHAVSTPSSTTPIFAASSSPPRRKPTNASTASAGGVSALSRNISSATTASADSYNDYPVHAQLQDIGEEGNSSPNGESQARYGETSRHLPQVFDRGTSASPFLSEPGMSAEEIERLDEEERRIDAAIAAADEQRQRDRGGPGMI